MPDAIITVENLYLQLAAETGLIGLAAFAATFGLFFALAVRVLPRYPSGAGRDIALATVAGAAAWLINGLTVTAYQMYVITVALGINFAVLVILDRDGPRSEHR